MPRRRRDFLRLPGVWGLVIFVCARVALCFFIPISTLFAGRHLLPGELRSNPLAGLGEVAGKPVRDFGHRCGRSG